MPKFSQLTHGSNLKIKNFFQTIISISKKFSPFVYASKKSRKFSKINPTNDQIGREFIRQYYTILKNKFSWLYKFYGKTSTMMRSDILPDEDEIIEIETNHDENSRDRAEEGQGDGEDKMNGEVSDNEDSGRVSIKKFNVKNKEPGLLVVKGQVNIRAELMILEEFMENVSIKVYNIDVCDFLENGLLRFGVGEKN